MRVHDGVIGSLGPQHRERRDVPPVEEEVQVVPLPIPQAPDVPGPVAREPDLDVVQPVLCERVQKRHAAARSDREAGNVLLLREVSRHTNHVALE